MSQRVDPAWANPSVERRSLEDIDDTITSRSTSTSLHQTGRTSRSEMKTGVISMGMRVVPVEVCRRSDVVAVVGGWESLIGHRWRRVIRLSGLELADGELRAQPPASLFILAYNAVAAARRMVREVRIHVDPRRIKTGRQVPVQSVPSRDARQRTCMMLGEVQILGMLLGIKPGSICPHLVRPVFHNYGLPG